MLVAKSGPGAALALRLEDKSAALMRGHGSVAVGTSLPQAVFSGYLPGSQRAAAVGGHETWEHQFSNAHGSKAGGRWKRYARIAAVDALEARIAK